MQQDSHARVYGLRHLTEQSKASEDLGEQQEANELRREFEQVKSALMEFTQMEGAIREPGSPLEKARTNVTKRINGALRLIETECPAAHNAIRHGLSLGANICFTSSANDPDWLLK